MSMARKKGAESKGKKNELAKKDLDEEHEDALETITEKEHDRKTDVKSDQDEQKTNETEITMASGANAVTVDPSAAHYQYPYPYPYAQPTGYPSYLSPYAPVDPDQEYLHQYYSQQAAMYIPAAGMTYEQRRSQNQMSAYFDTTKYPTAQGAPTAPPPTTVKPKPTKKELEMFRKRKEEKKRKKNQWLFE